MLEIIYFYMGEQEILQQWLDKWGYEKRFKLRQKYSRICYENI